MGPEEQAMTGDVEIGLIPKIKPHQVGIPIAAGVSPCGDQQSDRYRRLIPRGWVSTRRGLLNKAVTDLACSLKH